MVGRELAAPLVAEHRPFGDAQQRRMRLMVGRGGKIGLVAGDERQAARIGEIDQLRLDQPLMRQTVALQFDVQPVGKQRLEVVEARGGNVGAFGGEREIERPRRAAGQRDHPLGPRLKAGEVDMRLDARHRIEPGMRGKRHEVEVARLVLRQEDERPAPAAVIETARRQGQTVAEVDADLHAGDRLHALLRQLLGKFERTEEVVCVCQRQSRHVVGSSELHELGDRHGAFAERKGAMDVEVDEADAG